MVVADPISELLALVERVGDEPPSRVDRRSAELLRRQFGIALPPPFVAAPDTPSAAGLRRATGTDLPAVGAIYLRSGHSQEAAAQLVRRMVERSKEPEVRIVVAGRQGTVLGVSAFVPGNEPWVMVDRSIQDAGLGETLLGGLQGL